MTKLGGNWGKKEGNQTAKQVCWNNQSFAGIKQA